MLLGHAFLQYIQDSLLQKLPTPFQITFCRRMRKYSVPRKEASSCICESNLFKLVTFSNKLSTQPCFLFKDYFKAIFFFWSVFREIRNNEKQTGCLWYIVWFSLRSNSTSGSHTTKSASFPGTMAPWQRMRVGIRKRWQDNIR